VCLCPAAASQTPALWYLPGFVATAALLMINAVRREELGFDPDGFAGQKRGWLLLSYLVCFGAVGWAVAGLLVYFDKPGHDTYTGVAGVLQCVLIVAAALTFWVTRGGAAGSDAFYY
jgi:hypothetical protein